VYDRVIHAAPLERHRTTPAAHRVTNQQSAVGLERDVGSTFESSRRTITQPQMVASTQTQVMATNVLGVQSMHLCINFTSRPNSSLLGSTSALSRESRNHSPFILPTCGFCVNLFSTKIDAIIKNIGCIIGGEGEDDHNTVGLVEAKAKQLLLRLIPHIMPIGDEEQLLLPYVIDHGDLGFDNILIAMDKSDQRLSTSFFDWETGCIVPALPSHALMAVTVY
jgi:hypothetical protein